MSHSAPAKAVKQAVRYLRRHGLDGAHPVNHLEAMMSDRAAALDALRTTLERGGDHELAPAVRLARILEARELADAIGASVLRRPAPLAAKAEAVDALAALGVEVPEAVRGTLADVRRFVDSPDREGLQRILSLPESWKRPALGAWLESGSQRPELLELVLEAEPDRVTMVIERLGESGDAAAVAVLRRLEADADKDRVKQIRKALHRLRAAGVETDEAPAEPDAFSFAIETDPREARAWSSGIDGSGGRIVWISTPAPRGGEELLEAVLDDVSGLRRAETMAITRKGFREHLDRLRSNPAILVVQLPVEEAAGVLREAEALAREAGNELPEDFERWRDGVGGKLLGGAAAPANEPPTPSADPVPEAATGEYRRSVELLKDPLFHNWAVTGEMAEEAALGVRRAETSSVVVDDEQRKEQVDRAIAAAAAAVDAEQRERYRRRLEEMARLLEKARRPDDAELARLAAAGFSAVEDLYTSHPFARAMVQRGVLAAYQSVREREESAEPESRIVRP